MRWTRSVADERIFGNPGIGCVSAGNGSCIASKTFYPHSTVGAKIDIGRWETVARHPASLHRSAWPRRGHVWRSLGPSLCEGARAIDPAWRTRQTPISEDKGTYGVSTGRQRGGLQRFRACESSRQVATAATTTVLPSVM